MFDSSDDELVERARNGNREALGVLLERWYPLVWARLFRFSRDSCLATDLAHDVFVIFCLRRPFAPPLGLNAAQLRAWLCKTADYLWLNFQRNPRRRQQPLSDEQLDEIASRALEPVDQVAEAELLTRLRLHIENLSPNDREVIEMRYVADLSYEVMADRLGLTLGAVSGRVFQARARLYARLDRCDPELLAWVNEVMGARPLQD